MDKKKLSVGIVMPVRNCLKYTKQTYESFKTRYNYEWIIIDNASTDGTREWVEELEEEIIYLPQEENIGVARSWNLGIQTAFSQGHDLAFVINNDLVFAPDTFDNLMKWYGEESADLFEFVTVTNIGNDPEMLKTHKRTSVAVLAPQFIGFLCNQRTFRRIGWFDEGYELGYFEDNDFHERMREEDITAVAVLDAVVAHYGSRTIKEGDIDSDYQSATFNRNRVRFKDKYGYYPELVQQASARPPVMYDYPQRPRLFWIGDGVAPTGFARVSHSILNFLKDKWDVHLLALNYRGDPHDYPYNIYPAQTGGDIIGRNRILEIANFIQPSVICAINDPWVVGKYLELYDELNLPFLAYLPIDGGNQGPHAFRCRKLDLAIFYTQYGLEEFRKGEYRGEAAVIPHGINNYLYSPSPKDKCLEFFGLDRYMGEKPFIFVNVNRNQPRKRMDVTCKVFAQWYEEAGRPDDAYLFLHCDNTDGPGFNLAQMCKFYGVDSRLYIPGTDYSVWHGIPEEHMPLMYSCMDVQMSTTIGEGFGLTHLEGMACGVPQLVPDWSALGEWAKDAACMVPCNGTIVNPAQTNTVGGAVDEEQMVKEMHRLYENSKLREEYAQKGLELTARPEYRWSSIAAQFHTLLTRAAEERTKVEKEPEDTVVEV